LRMLVQLHNSWDSVVVESVVDIDVVSVIVLRK
jgi:hypothetical protein